LIEFGDYQDTIDPEPEPHVNRYAEAERMRGVPVL
jgi:hypothetical protein